MSYDQIEYGKPFNFRARVYLEDDLYVITLPHQCDNWHIAACDSKLEAMSELRRFISEAQDLLDKLTGAEGQGPDAWEEL